MTRRSIALILLWIGALAALPAPMCASPWAPILPIERSDSLGSEAEPFALLDLADHPKVASYLRYFQGPGRATMARWLERSSLYMPMIEDRLAEADLPTELGSLALIESGLRNNAVSRAGATGMWQFMPATARAYGLRVDHLVDERRDPFKATDAAVRHLADLRDRFGTLDLAAAAYNAGEGRVTRGLERLRGPLSDPGEEGRFFRLSDARLLARETRDYVPQLIAAAMIASDPARYSFDAPVARSLQIDSIVVTQSTRLDAIARERGVSSELVRALNPQYIRGVTPDRTPSIVRLPAGGTAEETAQLLRHLDRPVPRPPSIKRGISSAKSTRSNGKHVLVRRGETIAEVAHRCEVSVSELRRINILPAGYRLRPGQILRLPG